MELRNEVVQSPAMLKDIYGDLAKPGVRQAGKALSAIIEFGNTVLWPVSLIHEKAKIALEGNLEKYRSKMKDIPEEEVCEVAPEVGVPIAVKLSNVTNEELSEMYTELLANASQTQNAKAAHPSFINVINNISPDEAILIKSTRDKPGIPFIGARLKIKGKDEWTDLNPMIPGLSCLAKLHNPNNIHTYINNLESLGIFNSRQDVYMVGDNIYEPLEEYAKKAYSEAAKGTTNREISFQRGKIEITLFAERLMSACFTDKKV